LVVIEAQSLPIEEEKKSENNTSISFAPIAHVSG